MTALVRSALATSLGAGEVRAHHPRTALSGRLLVAVIVIVWSTTVVVDFRIALMLLMAIGFGVAAIGLRYPWLGLLGVAMLCTLNEIAAPLLLSGGLWRWNTLNYWLLIVSLLCWPTLLRFDDLQTRILVPFVLLLSLELLLSPDPERGVEHVLGVVSVFGLLIYFGRAGLDAEAWYWLGVVSGVLAAGGSAAFLLQRGRLPLVKPNIWSYLPVTAILAIGLAFVVNHGSLRRRQVLASLAVINAVWVFLSGSRGSVLIAAVCLGFLLTMMQLRRALSFGLVAALASVALLSQFTTLQERTVSRLRLLIDPTKSLSVRTSGRYDLALGAWYFFQDHPLGVGTGGFDTTWSELGPRGGLSRSHQWQRARAHAGWMQILAENGFPGFFLLGAYVLSFTVSGWRTGDPQLRRVGLMVTAVFAVGLVPNEFQNKALWLLAAGATVLLDGRVNGGARPRSDSIPRG